jgi:hypothetical protein
MSIFNHFEHINLTNDQKLALEKIQSFLESDKNVFILKGYAGSGKTTLLKGVAEYLSAIEKSYQLMAPTGRAAKVIHQKTGIVATTVHKGIYSFGELDEIESNKESGDVSFVYYYKLRTNPEVHDSVLIVDESSMLSDNLSEGEFFRFGTGYLLTDLFSYSQINLPNSSTKIIFIGDPAQLPPVGMAFSPALDGNYLQEKFNIETDNAEIKEVKRQQADNGILSAAGKIRKCLTSGFFNDFDLRANGKDIYNPAFERFNVEYNSVVGTKIIITYKNKTALDLNQNIRRAKYGDELPIQSGDIIIVGGNNYQLGIMNGEFGVVSTVSPESETRNISFKVKGGSTSTIHLTWRYIELLMPDLEGQTKLVKGYTLENFLYGDNYLTSEELQALYVDFRIRHPKLIPHTEEFKEAIIEDPYFHCIMLKYGYAVTCHKAQGGEWDNAFVFWDRATKDSFNFKESVHDRSGKTNSDFYRWAYTAITRASNKLFCINPPRFNSYSSISFIDTYVQQSYQELTAKSLAPVEINLDDALQATLLKFNLTNAPISIQDHFIKLNYLANQLSIDIVSWDKLSYEIRYGFKRANETAVIKFWINGKDEFKPTFQKLPAGTNSDNLYTELTKIIESNVSIVIVRNNANNSFTAIEFDSRIEEEKPFLKVLYSELQETLKKYSIQINNIDHQHYRERFFLNRGPEKAVVDFEYNGDGFFGRVLPLENKCNSIKLLTDIKDAVNYIQK